MNELSSLPTSRKQALELGVKYYLDPEKKCRFGNVHKRLASSRVCQCRQCRDLKNEQQRKRPLTEKEKESARKYSSTYHKNNRDEVLEKMKKRNKVYYQKNKEKIIKQTSEYQKKNSASRNAYKVLWVKNKASTDADFRLSLVIRKMIHRTLSLTGNKKALRSEAMLGYTAKQLRFVLEKQFLKGMCWDNYGDWHIDHITPISHFIKNGVTDPKIINCLSNLRPIWKEDNLRKSDSIEVLI